MKKFVLVLMFVPSLLAQPCASQTPLNKSGASQFAQYDLNVRLLPDAHRLEATGTVRLPAAQSSRESIELQLSNALGEPRVELLLDWGQACDLRFSVARHCCIFEGPRRQRFRIAKSQA